MHTTKSNNIAVIFVKSRGFTVIEIMVAVAIFSIIMVLGIGAVLNISNAHKKTEHVREVIDTLHFITEDISRNIRLGSVYNCQVSTGAIDEPEDCTFNAGSAPYYSIAFESVNGDTTDPDDQVVYRIVEVAGSNPSYGRIVKGVAGTTCDTSSSGSGCSTLTPDDIQIDMSKSGFNVYNAEAVGSGEQPYVLLRIVGKTMHKNIESPFAVQTVISQRQINL